MQFMFTLLTNSEHVGGQTHSIPMLLSFKAAIPSGGFKLENTSKFEIFTLMTKKTPKTFKSSLLTPIISQALNVMQ